MKQFYRVQLHFAWFGEMLVVFLHLKNLLLY